MRLNAAGRVASQCWCGIPKHFPTVTLDTFVVMPDHMHGIIVIGKRPDERKDRKSTRLNSSHSQISYAVFCLKKKSPIPPAYPSLVFFSSFGSLCFSAHCSSCTRDSD